MKRQPNHSLVINNAIHHILSAMEKNDNYSTDKHLATAVVLLNQITNIGQFDSEALQNQFIKCRELILGK